MPHRLSRAFAVARGEDEEGATGTVEGGWVAVDESGVLTPRGVGTTKVRARTYNGLKAIARVTVLPGPDSIALSEEELLLMPGELHILTVTLPVLSEERSST